MSDSANNTTRNPSSNPLPLLTWLAIQFATLLLAAMNTPLWARPAHPIESSALTLMIAVQAGAVALLFPWLLLDLKALLRVIFSAILFDQLSGMLAMRPATDVVAVSLGMTVWIAGLALWNRICWDFQSRLIATALASTLCIGFSVAIYASAEFGEGRFALDSRTIWTVVWGNLIAAGITHVARRFFAPSYPQVGVQLSTESGQKRG